MRRVYGAKICCGLLLLSQIPGRLESQVSPRRALLADVLGATRAPSSAVRLAALRLLSDSGDALPATDLSRLAGDEDAHVRESVAIRLVWEPGDPMRLRRIAMALASDSSPLVASRALASMWMRPELADCHELAEQITLTEDYKQLYRIAVLAAAGFDLDSELHGQAAQIVMDWLRRDWNQAGLYIVGPTQSRRALCIGSRLLNDADAQLFVTECLRCGIDPGFLRAWRGEYDLPDIAGHVERATAIREQALAAAMGGTWTVVSREDAMLAIRNSSTTWIGEGPHGTPWQKAWISQLFRELDDSWSGDVRPVFIGYEPSVVSMNSELLAPCLERSWVLFPLEVRWMEDLKEGCGLKRDIDIGNSLRDWGLRAPADSRLICMYGSGHTFGPWDPVETIQRDVGRKCLRVLVGSFIPSLENLQSIDDLRRQCWSKPGSDILLIRDPDFLENSQDMAVLRDYLHQ